MKNQAGNVTLEAAISHEPPAHIGEAGLAHQVQRINCATCKTTIDLHMPMDLNEFSEWVKRFNTKHKSCK